MVLSPRFDKISYFAPLPMLVLDPRGWICDVNLAMQLLLGKDIALHRSPTVDSILGPLAEQAEPSPTAEPGPSPAAAMVHAGSAVRAWTIRHVSEQSGAMELECSVVPLLDPNTGGLLGNTVYALVDGTEARRQFLSTLRQLWKRHLLWEEYAVSYDRIVSIMPYYQLVLDRHFAAITANGARDVIDLGAGTGTLGKRLTDAGLHVTAVDNSRAMLDKLRAKVDAHAADRLTLVEQSAEYLPQFADGVFDAVSILLALFDMANPDAALAEAIRLLRPGGILILTEPKQTFQMSPILEFVEGHLKRTGLDRSLAADLERVFHVNREINPATRDSGSPLRAEIVYERLAHHGFQELSIEDSHFGNCATVKGRKPCPVSAASQRGVSDVGE